MFRIFALVACLAFPFTATAAPLGAPLPDIDAPSLAAPPVAVAPAVAPAIAQPQIIYLTQQPATVAAPQPAATAPGFSFGGLLAGLGGIGALLATLLAAVFAVWRGSRAEAVRRAVVESADASWHIAEAIGGAGAKKYQEACRKFLDTMAAQGITPTPALLAVRDDVFAGLSAADNVRRARVATVPVDPTIAPVG